MTRQSKIWQHIFRLIGSLILVLFVGCSRGLKYNVDIDPDYYMSRNQLTKSPELQSKKRLFSTPLAIEVMNDSIALILTYRGEIYFWNTEVDKKRGNIWQPYREPISAHLLTDRYLYLGAVRDGDLIAFDLVKRRKAWRQKKIIVNLESMQIVGNTIYVSNSSRILAFDRTSGTELENRKLKHRFTSRLIKVSDRLIAFNENGDIQCFNLDLKIDFQTDLNMGKAVKADVYNDIIVAADDDGRLIVYNVDQQKMILEKEYSIPIYSQPFINDSIIIVALSNGKLIAHNYKRDLEIWRYSGTGLVNLPLLATDSTILIPFIRGYILALTIEEGRELWRYDTENVISYVNLTNNGILLSDKNNYLHTLKCIQ